jgi:hypothetical protein
VTYYKATRPDGTDFQTGTIDYGAALVSGEVIRHASKKKTRDEPSSYLSVSVAATDCTGMRWPCRLFRVEPVGRVMTNLSASPNKRAVSALRVVEELPAHQSLGPNGEQVAAFIEACRSPTFDDWRKVGAAWDAARAAVGDAAWAAVGDAAWGAAWAAVGAAVGAAAWAIIARDLITTEQYDLLTQPLVDAGFAAMVDR